MIDNNAPEKDDLGKIQDILFGQQQRDTAQQLVELETRINERLAILDQSHKAIDAKLESLKHKQTDRKALSGMLEKMAKQLTE